MLGVDVVDIERFRGLLERAPGLAARFFTADELGHCDGSADRNRSLAGTFAAKEATMKALGLTPAPAWARRIEIVWGPSGAPQAVIGRRTIPVSISHDGPVAVAVALQA